MNQKHYDLLTKSVSEFNEWRTKNPDEQIDLKDADLRWANLLGANLLGADLRDADLRDANLQDADLRDVNLKDADLRDADFPGADLRGANLQDANLQDADLRDANLKESNFKGADLRGARLPAPTIVLLANWKDCSPNTTKELMRLDASAHPYQSDFDRWANGSNICPYDNVRIQRVANFQECMKDWEPGPPPSIYEAMCMVLDEHCPNWED